VKDRNDSSLMAAGYEEE